MLTKLLTPGSNNQAKAINFLIDEIGAKQLPRDQDKIIKYGKGDRRCKDLQGMFYVIVCAETGQAPANIPPIDGEYNRHFFKLFCRGVKIVRQVGDRTGRVMVYTIATPDWLKVLEKSITRAAVQIPWDEVKRLCKQPPLVIQPYLNQEKVHALQSISRSTAG